MTRHLKVLKSEAQSAVALLKEWNALDRNFQIKKEGEFVFLPIAERCEDSVFRQLGKQIVDIPGLESKAKLLPKGAGGAFDLIGDIAITKVRPRERAEKLANTLLDSHPNIKAVYLDRGVTGEYRLRDLELLSGEPLVETKYKENGVNFIIDVSRVYFSPRLATERMFVAKEVVEGEYILDMFAGIGSFSLNIAHLQSVRIVAIDSNPRAIEYMQRSIVLNTLKGTIIPICGDSKHEIEKFGQFDRIIMNLPHDAFRYLDVAIKKLRPGGILHYYEIMNVEDLAKRMEELNSLGLSIVRKREVHGYSTTSSMYSLTAAKSKK